jgi:hypothetical protein
MFGKWRERRDAERRARASAAADEQYRQALSQWEAARQQLTDFIAETGGAPAAEQSTLELKRGELPWLEYEGAGLVEPRRTPGHYQGGYQGFSFRIAKGVRYHVGGTRGTYVPGDERPTIIDTGTVTITDQRVVFRGMKQSREWAFTKLLGVEHDPTLPMTALPVSNRQKVSGFLYDQVHAPLVRFRLSLALAHHRNEVDHLRSSLEEELRQLDAERPTPPELTTTAG